MANPEAIRRIAHSRAPLSTWLGIVLLFALFGVIVLAVIGPSPRGSDFEETRAKKRLETLKTLREEADKTLTTYGWIDKAKGVAHIPIGRAMELTLAELAKEKPAPAGPIATPGTQPAASGGASPATAASPAAGKPVQPAGASPPAQAPVSFSPASQSSPSSPTSPSPAKSP